MYVSEELKRKVKDIPIMDVAHLLGIKFYRGTLAYCFIPGHPDKHASLRFWPQKNRWKCFSCTSEEGQRGGDSITLVMVHEGLPYNDAVVWLANNFNIYIHDCRVSTYSKPKRSKHRKYLQQERPDTPTANVDIELLEWVVSVGKLSPEAESFLFSERKYKDSVVHERRIFSISDKFRFANAIIEKFGVDRALASRLIIHHVGNLYRSALDDKCVVFPYFDIDGSVINLQSRKYVPCDKKYRYKFPPGLPIHMYNIDLTNIFPADKPIYIAEGVTDCLAMLSDGKNAVAIPGVNNFNPDDIFALQRHRLFIYPDNDDAGKTLIKTLNEKYELNVGVLNVPEPFDDYCDYYTSKQI